VIGGVTIRPAVHTDLGALFAYLGDQLKENGMGGVPLFQPMPRSESRISAEKEAGFITGMGTPLGEPGWRRVWIAQDSTGAIAGHIDLRARAERTAAHRAMLGMGVHREHRRQGLGMRLVGTALAWASEQQGIDWVDLEVLSVNAGARRLYVRAGFDTIGEVADMFRIDGEQHAYTFMTRKL
jgi:ribosomal protein S18 acetylase RimI-like enzyme